MLLREPLFNLSYRANRPVQLKLLPEVLDQHIWGIARAQELKFCHGTVVRSAISWDLERLGVELESYWFLLFLRFGQYLGLDPLFESLEGLDHLIGCHGLPD